MQERSGIGTGIAIMAIIIAGIVVMCNILLHNTGGISGMVLYFGGALCLWCLVSPPKGIYVLGFFCFYLDFVKKLAVVYGVASMNTVIEVLVIQLLALGGVVLGTLVRLSIFEHRLARRHVVAFALACAVTAVVFFLTKSQGLTAALQASANNGAYVGMILVCLVHLENRASMVRYLDYLFWLGIPWAAYGIVQSYWGFADFEWEYAKTGLSAVSSSAMLYFEKPRPFGFASGEAGYSVLMLFEAYGIWRIIATRSNKLLWIPATAVVVVALVTSLQRTALVLPAEIIVVALVYRNRAATMFSYAAGLAIFVAAVAFSDQLLSGMTMFDESVNLKSEWAQRVVKVSTWADRLNGWHRLKSASTYTLIGKRWGQKKFEEGLQAGDEDGAHDMINPTLNNFGVVGALVIFGIPVWLMGRTHRAIWAMPKGDDRYWAMFLLATAVVYVGQASIGGSNLGTTPINLIIWTVVGCLSATMMRKPEDPETVEEKAMELESDAKVAPVAMAPSFKPFGDPVEVAHRRRVGALRKSGVMKNY